MIDGEEMVDPRFDPRFDGRWFQLLVPEIGQFAKLGSRRFQSGETGLQFILIPRGHGVSEIDLNLVGYVGVQRFDTFDANFDVVQRRLCQYIDKRESSNETWYLYYILEL